jgi:hypothetical protein
MKILSIVLLIFWSLTIDAQIGLNISSGIGYSMTNKAIQNSQSSDIMFKSKPVLISNIDWIKKDSRLGFGASFSYDKSYWKIGFYKINAGVLYTSANLKRLNIGGRLTYTIIQDKTIDLYTGLRAGISLYTSTYDFQRNYYQNSGYIEMSNNYKDTYFISLRETVSYQFLLGGKLSFNKNLGMYAELGIGNSPCLFNSGFLVRF